MWECVHGSQLPLGQTRLRPAPTVHLREVSALQGDEVTEVQQGPTPHVHFREVPALTRCPLRYPYLNSLILKGLSQPLPCSCLHLGTRSTKLLKISTKKKNTSPRRINRLTFSFTLLGLWCFPQHYQVK